MCIERPFTILSVIKIPFTNFFAVVAAGMSLHTFHGNFFVRSTDLLSLPCVNPDLSYTINISIDDDLQELGSVCFQAALLYTSSKGKAGP